MRLRYTNYAIGLALITLAVWVVWLAATNFDYNWNWAQPMRYFIRVNDDGSWSTNLLLDGFLLTLRLALWGCILCSVFGLVIGLMRISQLAAIRLIAACYVELIRNMPPLVFIFVMYFFVSSQLLPPELTSGLARAAREYPWLSLPFGPPELLENFLAGLLCIALYEAAYVAEIVRGGVQSIDNGQWEGARALGLRRWPTLRLVILPQALRKVLPPYASQLISLVKDSSIISVISVQELTFAGIEVATSTGRLFETLMLISALYFLLCWPASLLLRRQEQAPAGQQL